MQELIYLATPYSHESEDEMNFRYGYTCEILGSLLDDGLLVYSPIAHTHHAATIVKLPSDWQFWQTHCELMLSKCNRLLVAKMDGWEQSRGVQAEIEYAKKIGIPVEFLEV